MRSKLSKVIAVTACGNGKARLVRAALLISCNPAWAQDASLEVVRGDAQRHFHNADMTCCAPCAPESNDDPDVMRRPCFVRALARSLEKPKIYGGITDGVEVKRMQGDIPAHVIDGFRGLLSSVLHPAILPHKWDKVQFYVPYPVKLLSEIRGGRLVLVGHTSDRATEANEAKYDAIQGSWTVGQMEVLPRAFEAGSDPKSAVIRLRIHGGERLALGERPEHFTRSPKDFEAFFNREAFHALLAKTLQIPFASPDDYQVDGYDAAYEGVRVFHGRIVSVDWAHAEKLSENKFRDPPHWWDEMRLLVTDSNPQYFCVQIILRELDQRP